MPSIRRSRTLALGAAFALFLSLAGSAALAQTRAAGTAPAPTPPVSGAAPAAPATPPAQPLIFGAAAPTKANLIAQEGVAGRPIVAVRIYRLWDQPLFGPDQIWERDTYHTLFLSIKPRRSDGSNVRWADIAAATPGTPLYQDMQKIAAQIKAFGNRVYLTFSHEPEASSSDPLGTGPEFAAAFRAFMTVMRTAQANVRPVAIFTGYAFKRTDAKSINTFYPGDAYVTAVGIDVYNWGSCQNRPWTSLAQLIEPARLWGMAHPAVPLLLTEWGSVENPAVPGAKAAWITDSGNLLRQPGYGQFAGLFAWGGLNPVTACPFDYNTSPSAAAAWTAIGHDPGYSGWE